MMLGVRTGAWAKNGSPTPAAYGGLRFTAEADNSSVQLTAVGSAPAVTLVKSFDGVNWEAYTVGEVIDLPSTGDCVYLAAGEGGNEIFGSSSARKYNRFVINGLVAASGDITSLRRFDLEQTTLASYCYAYMFRGCTGLTSAPELPATTLAVGCYQYMFSGCTGLTNAPELPATTLANNCYAYMFRGCTGLTGAPELPATTLDTNCYRYMFSGCTSLTSAPELPATTLASYCYNYMFEGCTGLTNAPELPATTLDTNCYAYMFSGCTSLTSAPELPTTTLANNCYYSMFSGCTSLTSAPELPATTLASYCYSSMFDGCTNISLIKVHFTAWGTQTTNWVSEMSRTGTFYKPTALPEEYGTSKIPTGWAVVNIG